MSRNYRKERGAETQNLVASVFRAAGWDHAESAGAGRPGRDILGVPALAVEVKARRDFNPVGFVKQAESYADGDLPLAVVRPDGMGPASVTEWPVVLRFGDVLELLRAAGYAGGEK
jgi:hypothetical protein